MKEPAEDFQKSRATSKRLWSTPLADGSMPFVRMHQLWEMAEGLPSRKVRVEELHALDDVRWFSELMGKLPTCRAVAEHARDIYEADFEHPIILSPTGVVLDGMHRLCKAFLEGIEEIEAVQLPEMPPAQWRLLSTGEEVAHAGDAAPPRTDPRGSPSAEPPIRPALPNPRDYEIRIRWSGKPGDECYVAQVVEWPSIMAHGGSREAAAYEIQLALEGAIEFAGETGAVVPEPARHESVA